MNRKERRQVEKKLGLMKQYHGMSRSEKFDMIAERIKIGKERQTETTEKIKTALEEQENNRISKQIENNAEIIARAEGISITEATEKAQEEIKKYKK
jgi:hypothetical protein